MCMGSALRAVGPPVERASALCAGDPLAVSIDRWVSLVAPHARTGRLRFVYLGGCRSRALGRALRDAGVECVVCASTVHA